MVEGLGGFVWRSIEGGVAWYEDKEHDDNEGRSGEISGVSSKVGW